MGIPYTSYQLASTPALRTKLLTTAGNTDLLAQANLNQPQDSGFIDLDNDGNWWLPSGTTVFPANADENFYLPSWVADALGSSTTMHYDHYQLFATSITDAVGNTTQALHTYTPVTGHQYAWTDVGGRLLIAWDNPDKAASKTITATYDALHRPLKSYVAVGNNAPVCLAQTVYGDDPSLTLPNGHNLRGQVYQSFDQAGVMTTEVVDFKGNPLEMSQQMAANYTSTIDWDALPTPTLEPEVFTTKSSYDALNRPTRTTLPNGSQFRPTYGKGAYTEQLEARVQRTWYTVMTGQTFDAKGQRQQVNYGNNTLTQYFYNPQNFRLERMLSLHQNQDQLQDLYYTYDAVGNVTTIKDKAQSTNYYNNRAVSPFKEFTYDARYRLLTATGREHIDTTVSTHAALPHLSNLPNQNIQSATRTYTQSYRYDAAGNILELDHKAQNNNWKRVYNYQNNATNQLASTTLSGLPTNYSYDLRGNMIGLPHLQALQWNETEELTAVQLNTNDWAYYRYSGGQRVRKVIDKANKQEERLYLGGVERYREYSTSGAVQLERWTLLVEGIAQFDTLTMNNGQVVVGSVPTIRYQYRDHLGSSTVEANEVGQVISYEDERLFFCH